MTRDPSLDRMPAARPDRAAPDRSRETLPPPERASTGPGQGRMPRRSLLHRAGVGAGALGTLLVVPPLTATAAGGFTDTRNNKFADEIAWMRSVGIATGFPDGTYRPLEPVARDAMAAFIHRFAGSPPLPAYRGVFLDVPRGLQFAREIEWLQAQGVAWGWPDGTYRPHRRIARDAMAAFLFRLLDQRLRVRGVRIDAGSAGRFRDEGTSKQFIAEMRWMRAADVSTGWSNNTFRPLQPVARDAMAAFLYRAAQLAARA